MAKKHEIPQNPDAGAIEEMKLDMSKEPLTVDTEKKRLGNAMGLTLKDELSNLHKEIHELQKQRSMEEVIGEEDFILTVRAFTFDECRRQTETQLLMRIDFLVERLDG